MSDSKNKKTRNDLTARESQVLDLLVKDLSDKEIADRMGVSYSAIRRHFENLARKLKKRTRTGLGIWFARRRWLVDSPARQAPQQAAILPPCSSKSH